MNLFNERLETFGLPKAAMETAELKCLLTDMTSANANPESLLELTRRNPIRDLPQIIEDAVKTEYIVAPGVSMKLFDGEYTVVVLRNGFISGICENTDGPIHNHYGVPEYGYTLVPYALAKAYRRLYLERIGFNGGIMNLANNMFLRNIGPENVGVFIGDAAVSRSKYGAFVVGVSGALMTPEFVEFLTGGNVKEHTPGLFAGLGDVALAEAVVKRLSGQNLGSNLLSESVVQLAFWH